MTTALPAGITVEAPPDRDPTPVIFHIDLRELPEGDDARGSVFGGRTLCRIEIIDENGKAAWAHVSVVGGTTIAVNAVGRTADVRRTVTLRPWQPATPKKREPALGWVKNREGEWGAYPRIGPAFEIYQIGDQFAVSQGKWSSRAQSFKSATGLGYRTTLDEAKDLAEVNRAAWSANRRKVRAGKVS